MLPPNEERIALTDEYGTGELAFIISWHGQSLRLLVYRDTLHTGQVRMSDHDRAVPEKPTDLTFLEALMVDMVRAGAHPRRVKE